MRPIASETGAGWSVKPLEKGMFCARLATSGADIKAAQRLRAKAFGLSRALDKDGFDQHSQHVLIEHVEQGALVGCFRVQPFTSTTLDRSYSAQFYDLSALITHSGPMLELGRFCLHPEWVDPDIVRLAWAILTRIVDEQGHKLLFGCTSFPGTDPDRYAIAFALLRARCLAPPQWRPKRKGANWVSLDASDHRCGSSREGWQTLPALLRTYITMGGWVSDHAVVDPEMNTLHVFTGVEVNRIPESRRRVLRAVAM